MRGKDFPGQSGRSHRLYPEKLGEWVIEQMEAKGLSDRVASDYNYDRTATAGDTGNDVSEFFHTHPDFRKAVYAFEAALSRVIEREGDAAGKIWAKLPNIDENALKQYLIHTVAARSPGGRHAVGELMGSIIIHGL
jgi:hypothetical protein